VARSSCASGFVDNVMFSHKPPMGQNQTRSYESSSSICGGTRAKSDVYDCHVV